MSYGQLSIVVLVAVAECCLAHSLGWISIFAESTVKKKLVALGTGRHKLLQEPEVILPNGPGE